MLAYSARKNSANAMPEYSTMWPATISDSPSTTSNGARLVSAMPEMKYDHEQRQQRQPVPRQKSAQCDVPRLRHDDVGEFRLPATISTTTSAKPMAISYDTICAAERIAPRNAYLEFDAQPAMITPYTPIEVIAITYSRPALMLASTSFGSNGITAQAANAGISVMTGASRNSTLLALRRHDDLLDQQLQHVGDRLQQAAAADAVRPEAHLHPADHLALPDQ